MTDPRTLYAQSGVPFNAQVAGQFSNQLPSNLVGTMTVGVYDAPYPAGNVIVAPTTSGITEASLDGDPTNPIYTADLTVNQALVNGEVRFNYPGHQAVLPLVVTTAAPVGTPGTATIVFPDPSRGIQAFQPGNDLPLEVQIADANGPADPATLTLTLRNPTGQKTTVLWPDDDDIVRLVTGSFRYQQPSPASGRWQCEWDSTDPVSGTGIVAFTVLPRIGH